MTESIHGMITRSKMKQNETIIDLNDDKSDLSDLSDLSDIDEHGNLKGFIDYDCQEPFDTNEFQKQISILSRGSINYEINQSPKKEYKKKKGKEKGKGKGKGKEKGKGKNKKLNDILMSYLIMKATDKANIELKKNKKEKKKKKKKIKVSEIDIPNEINLDTEKQEDNDKSLIIQLQNDIKYDSDDSDDSSFVSAEESENSESLDSLVSDENESDESDESDDSLSDTNSDDTEYSFEYDEYDEKYEDLIDQQMNLNSEEANMEFFHKLSETKKKELIQKTQEIYNLNDKNIPLRFKIIESDMELKTKAIAMENIDKLSEMDVSTGEYNKMDHWINGLLRIPFGKYMDLPIQSDRPDNEISKFIKETSNTLNKAIYGHQEAKTHILQVIGKWIKNPNSGGNVLAIQGPMGNGKTTLVKDGISKVLNRPFAFIALGGASDSAYFDGHSYTYEGSHWGRIVQILHDSKCMNPVIYFDELDKISDTPKGEEIVHMLTHLTDPSQNSLFQDNYFSGINLDLSKALFIFSYNNENMINKILKDRMYVINTKGFSVDDKLKISREYLIPEIYKTYSFKGEDILFTDEIIQKIISMYTQGEEGVRNLKRCIETIISKINIYILSQETTNLSFTLKDFKLPVTLNENHIEELLKINSSDTPPFHMYC
tara:strand:- start:1097 stop:3070 length:1974 start_codon:yes stop_codon:yes gene_type:complete